MSARTRATAAVLAGLTALALAGCGIGGDSDAQDPVVLTVTASPTASPSDEGPESSITASAGETPHAEASSGVNYKAERQLFDADSPWNQRVDQAPRDSRSEIMMRYASERRGVREQVGDSAPQVTTRQMHNGLYINTERWTVPIVAGGEPTQLVCRQEVCGFGEREMTMIVPTDISPDPRFDGWFTIFDPNGRYAYDLWRARREDNDTITYQYMKRWDLEGPGYQEPYNFSARGSGLPLFAGVIRPGELQAGRIDHALAISLPGPARGNFVQPASASDGVGRATSLPIGARIRLKAGVVMEPPIDERTGEPLKFTAQQRRMADAIVATLRTYGAVVVDRARVPTLYAQRDVTRNLIRGSELQGLHLSDFEVTDLGHVYPFPAEDETPSPMSSPSSTSPSTSTATPSTRTPSPTTGATP